MIGHEPMDLLVTPYVEQTVLEKSLSLEPKLFICLLNAILLAEDSLSQCDFRFHSGQNKDGRQSICSMSLDLHNEHTKHLQKITESF